MKIKIDATSNITKVVFTGPIDEEILERLEAVRVSLVGDLEFDCGGIPKLNSIGVGLWMDFLRSLPPSTTYEFTNCTVAFVGYANAIPQFVGNGSIRTFEVPSYCEACDEVSAFLVQAVDANEQMLLPACPNCNGKAIPEIPLDGYLAFIGSR